MTIYVNLCVFEDLKKSKFRTSQFETELESEIRRRNIQELKKQLDTEHSQHLLSDHYKLENLVKHHPLEGLFKLNSNIFLEELRAQRYRMKYKKLKAKFKQHNLQHNLELNEKQS